jgi:hypothetical protein
MTHWFWFHSVLLRSLHVSQQLYTLVFKGFLLSETKRTEREADCSLISACFRKLAICRSLYTCYQKRSVEGISLVAAGATWNGRLISGSWMVVMQAHEMTSWWSRHKRRIVTAAPPKCSCDMHTQAHTLTLRPCLFLRVAAISIQYWTWAPNAIYTTHQLLTLWRNS